MFSVPLLLGGLAALSTSANGASSSSPLVSKTGQVANIPNWDFQSSSDAKGKIAAMAKPNYDSSSWHHTDQARCTLMACLIDAGVYDGEKLFVSDNLNQVDTTQFNVPWLYRNAFALAPQKGQHYFLETNGIIPYADIYLNGKEIADKKVQAGAYGGHSFEITDLAAEKNALVVRVYPTDVDFDFAVGFVDWNPSAPDNGTGVWRYINVRQTGPVALGPLSALVDIDTPVESSPAKVTIRTQAQNLENHQVKVKVEGTITDDAGNAIATIKSSETLAAGQTKLLELSHTIKQPKIWWPHEWGAQPLYDAKISVSVDSAMSDSVEHTFGIRTASYSVNKYNDGMYTVNGHPFQARGGGYSADMFLRWSNERFETIVQYMLDMGMNTVRLEGKMEQPDLYAIADKYGLMVMPGWECCDKWEAWAYNTNIDNPPLFTENDYQTINASMKHEAAVLQPHPSVIGFLVGSDFYPNDRAYGIYHDALEDAGWQVGIVVSAAEQGHPNATGPSGMSMLGPYDYVSTSYWYDAVLDESHDGAAAGFGSELASGVGTPTIGSLKKFLNESTLESLWKEPDAGQFHMSIEDSSFHDRSIYNKALWNSYGAPKSLDDYILKTQIVDYEATRVQFEAYSSYWDNERPATGAIYWMLNGAWPTLHWNNFDYYFHPGGSFFGTKVGNRLEHIAYNYLNKTLWLINHSLDRKGARTVDVELMDLKGKKLYSKTVNTTTKANSASNIADISDQINKIKDVAFLRLVLSDDKGKSVSRNVYWLTKDVDVNDWKNSEWYYTPITSYVDYTPLNDMDKAELSVKAVKSCKPAVPDTQSRIISVENKSDVPAFFVRLNLADANGDDVTPVLWSDNYFTLWPHETLKVKVTHWQADSTVVQVSGGNVGDSEIKLA